MLLFYNLLNLAQITIGYLYAESRPVCCSQVFDFFYGLGRVSLVWLEVLAFIGFHDLDIWLLYVQLALEWSVIYLVFIIEDAPSSVLLGHSNRFLAGLAIQISVEYILIPAFTLKTRRQTRSGHVKSWFDERNFPYRGRFAFRQGIVPFLYAHLYLLVLLNWFIV